MLVKKPSVDFKIVHVYISVSLLPLVRRNNCGEGRLFFGKDFVPGFSPLSCTNYIPLSQALSFRMAIK